MNFHNFKSHIKNVNVINVNFDNLTNNMSLRKTIESYNYATHQGLRSRSFPASQRRCCSSQPSKRFWRWCQTSACLRLRPTCLWTIWRPRRPTEARQRWGSCLQCWSGTWRAPGTIESNPYLQKTKLFKKAVGYIFWHFKALRLPNQSHAREHFIQI